MISYIQKNNQSCDSDVSVIFLGFTGVDWFCGTKIKILLSRIKKWQILKKAGDSNYWKAPSNHRWTSRSHFYHCSDNVINNDNFSIKKSFLPLERQSISSILFYEWDAKFLDMNFLFVISHS